MKYFFLPLLFFVHSTIFSQEKTDNETIDHEIVNENITKAKPQNGIDHFKVDFAKALVLSDKRIIEINKRHLRINLTFNVDETGLISDIRIINDKYQLKDEVVQTFEKLPKWIPAQENGKNVASTFALPIVLNIGLPDYELDENRIPKIALQQADFNAFLYEFNSHMIYPKDFWNRYYYKRDGYDLGNNETSNVFKYEVKFIINEEGKFEDIKTFINEKSDPHLNNSVKKALAKCQAWEPATINGEKVKSAFTLPITINIKK